MINSWVSVLYRQHDRAAVLIFALALAKTELEAMQMSAGWFYGGGAEAFKGGGGGGYRPNRAAHFERIR